MNRRNINRPVYLARRDKFYLKALERLDMDLFDLPAEQRHTELERTIELFNEIKENSVNAMRRAEHDPKEDNFLRCIELVIDSFEAVKILSGYETLLAHDKSFINQFLGENINNVDEHEHSAQEVAKYIIKWTQSLLAKVTGRFEKLKKDNFNFLSDEDKIRYQLMLTRNE